MRQILEGNEPRKETVAEPSHCMQTVAKAGCYTVGLIFGLVALASMWFLVYTPSEYVGRILIGAITGLSIVVFLWLLLIQRWWFLK